MISHFVKKHSEGTRKQKISLGRSLGNLCILVMIVIAAVRKSSPNSTLLLLCGAGHDVSFCLPLRATSTATHLCRTVSRRTTAPTTSLHCPPSIPPTSPIGTQKPATLTSDTLSAIFNLTMTTANLRLANAETVTLFSTSEGLVPVSVNSVGGTNQTRIREDIRGWKAKR